MDAFIISPNLPQMLTVIGSAGGLGGTYLYFNDDTYLSFNDDTYLTFLDA